MFSNDYEIFVTMYNLLLFQILSFEHLVWYCKFILLFIHQREAQAQQELLDLELQLEEERLDAVQREDVKQRERLDKELQLKAILKDQMGELKQREMEVSQPMLLE